MRDLTSNGAPKTPLDQRPSLSPSAPLSDKARHTEILYVLNDDRSGAVAGYRLNKTQRFTI